MSELLLPSRRRLPTIVPPLLSFTAGFIDSFTVLALFGLFVAQVTGSFVLRATKSLPVVAVVPESRTNSRFAARAADGMTEASLGDVGVDPGTRHQRSEAVHREGSWLLLRAVAS